MLDDKVDLIKESRRKKTDVCREFDLVKSIVGTVIQKQEEIWKSFDEGRQWKKIRFTDVNMLSNVEDATASPSILYFYFNRLAFGVPSGSEPLCDLYEVNMQLPRGVSVMNGDQ
ncbi:hypothetical protein Trydic_g3999 [Trypoxylus dichotomus]